MPGDVSLNRADIHFFASGSHLWSSVTGVGYGLVKGEEIWSVYFDLGQSQDRELQQSDGAKFRARLSCSGCAVGGVWVVLLMYG